MPPFDPTIMIGEFVYTLIIVVFCGIIYWKTKDIYELTKYKGIKYFRNTFLFLGLSYLLRFVTHVAMMTTRALDFFIPRNIMMGITLLPVGYLSTMALFYLMYSLIWKRIEQKHFLIFANMIAIIVSIAAFVSRSPELITLIQLTLLVFTIIMSLLMHQKGKKTPQITVLYTFLFIFWLINMFRLGPRGILPPWLRLPVQIISMLVFIAIYYKVSKWTK